MRGRELSSAQLSSHASDAQALHGTARDAFPQRRPCVAVVSESCVCVRALTWPPADPKKADLTSSCQPPLTWLELGFGLRLGLGLGLGFGFGFGFGFGLGIGLGLGLGRRRAVAATRCAHAPVHLVVQRGGQIVEAHVAHEADLVPIWLGLG